MKEIKPAKPILVSNLGKLCFVEERKGRTEELYSNIIYFFNIPSTVVTKFGFVLSEL